MYRAVYNLLPKKLSSFLKTVNQLHSHDARNSTNYVVPYARTGFRAASIKALGPCLWNSLSGEQKEVKSINSFKKKMKLTYLLKFSKLLNPTLPTSRLMCIACSGNRILFIKRRSGIVFH